MEFIRVIEKDWAEKYSKWERERKKKSRGVKNDNEQNVVCALDFKKPIASENF